MAIEGLSDRQIWLCDLMWKSESVYKLINNVYDEDLRKEIATLAQLIIMDQYDDPDLLSQTGLGVYFEKIFEKMKQPPLQ
jgi:hypothetical protein